MISLPRYVSPMVNQRRQTMATVEPPVTADSLLMHGTVSITKRQHSNEHSQEREAITAGSMISQALSHLPPPGSRNNGIYTSRYRTSSIITPAVAMRHGQTADNTSPRPSMLKGSVNH